jgi:LPS export ABC transporter protein LptC
VSRTLALTVCALLWLTGCEERIRPSVVHLATDSLPSQESWRSTVRLTDSARVRAVLWAGHIATFAEGQYTLLADSVHVTFFNELGELSSTLTARRGRVDDRTHDLEAFEDVVVSSEDSTVLRTDRLFWTNATRLIHTDAYVEIVSPREVIRGEGLESDQSLTNYRIFRVRGRSNADG